MSELRQALATTIGNHTVPIKAALADGEQAWPASIYILIGAEEVDELADAVLRVLAEHGDTQQVEEELVSSGALVLPRGDRINAIMAVVAPAISRARYFNAQDRIRLYEQLERAEADLAVAQMALRVARHRLDKVRALAERQLSDQASGGDSKRGWIYAHDALAILDAPARPAGHDETGQ
jgi:hypothetical protein